jgi:hypothetical protein
VKIVMFLPLIALAAALEQGGTPLIRLRLNENGVQSQYLVFEKARKIYIQRSTPNLVSEAKELESFHYDLLFREVFEPVAAKASEGKQPRGDCGKAAELSWSRSARKEGAGSYKLCLNGELGKLVNRLATRLDTESVAAGR